MIRKINTVVNFCGTQKKYTAPLASNYIKQDRLVDTFIKLAKIDSGSKEELAEKQIPSTECQKEMAKVLVEELRKIGLEDVNIDENYIVSATLKSNLNKPAKTIGLIAHYDTNEDAPNENVKPQIHRYTNGDIKLKDGTVIPEEDLAPYKNQEIITSDGTTLLGADDKAGIAEILEVAQILVQNPDIKHPTIRIAFTPDEETGAGISKFDIESFGADVAYTIDGSTPESIQNETFNAYNSEIIIKGKQVHTGYAKDKMINSLEAAAWFVGKLPENEKPEKTENKQGFYHIEKISGDVSETKINMLIRDHDLKEAKNRVEFVENLCREAEEKFGCKIAINTKESYLNMKEYIDKYPEVMENAIEGIKRSGLEVQCKVVRGGTDGSDLSSRGLPTPNLGAGGINFHSKTEFLPVSSLVKCSENIFNIIQTWVERS